MGIRRTVKQEGKLRSWPVEPDIPGMPSTCYSASHRLGIAGEEGSFREYCFAFYGKQALNVRWCSVISVIFIAKTPAPLLG
jgi:hypothetical protein